MDGMYSHGQVCFVVFHVSILPVIFIFFVSPSPPPRPFSKFGFCGVYLPLKLQCAENAVIGRGIFYPSLLKRRLTAFPIRNSMLPGIIAIHIEVRAMAPVTFASVRGGEMTYPVVRSIISNGQTFGMWYLRANSDSK